jgi:hypothetical protein
MALNPWRDRATPLANHFLSRRPNTSPHFLCLQRDKAGAGLLERIATPHKIRQGPAGLCGPAALLFDLVSRDPERYAEFGINLFEKGSAKIRKWEVKPNQALKIALAPAGMDQADWLMMASIRNSENTVLFDYDEPSGDWNQFKGITLPRGNEELAEQGGLHPGGRRNQHDQVSGDERGQRQGGERKVRGRLGNFSLHWRRDAEFPHGAYFQLAPQPLGETEVNHRHPAQCGQV